MTTVGQALVSGLRARGVDVVFGIPGFHTIELYRGLSGSDIRHVTARHEQGAVFMADGYSRVAGKPGVAFVITGPGLTNALTAMAQAKADSIPLLVVSGVNRLSSLGRGLGLLHEMPDQAAMVATLCPTIRIEGPQDLTPALDRAFALMTGGRPGPVHIEVPTDVMPLPCPLPGAPETVAPPDVPQDWEIAQAAERLNGAKRPVLLVGGGAIHAGGALRHLAESLDAPVIQTVNARGLMHGHDLTVPASPSLDAVRALIAEADQVLAIGTELGFTDYDMYGRGGLPDLSAMIRIDICARQLARHPAALALQGDAGATISALLPLILPARREGISRAAATRMAARGELPPDYQRILPLLEVIRDARPGSIIVGDSTQPVYAGNLYHDHDRSGGWFNSSVGFGSLGYAPGGAVGAAIASPGTHVTCLIGDGGLQFSPGELRAAVDEDLNITYIVWNNAGFGEIASNMRDAGIEVIGCTPSPLNMEPFAAACDLPFARIAPDPAALRTELAKTGTGPKLIEIIDL